jgi:hypothetical protein
MNKIRSAVLITATLLLTSCANTTPLSELQDYWQKHNHESWGPVYKGTKDGYHHILCGIPTFRVNASELTIEKPFPLTNDTTKWREFSIPTPEQNIKQLKAEISAQLQVALREPAPTPAIPINVPELSRTPYDTDSKKSAEYRKGYHEGFLAGYEGRLVDFLTDSVYTTGFRHGWKDGDKEGEAAAKTKEVHIRMLKNKLQDLEEQQQKSK